MSQIKKGDIITLIKYDEPEGPHWTEEECRKIGVVVGRSYKCIGTLILTAANYYIPSRASLPGVTIEAARSKWGLHKPCMPTECFRLATPEEIREWRWNPPGSSTRASKALRKALKKAKTCELKK